MWKKDAIDVTNGIHKETINNKENVLNIMEK